MKAAIARTPRTEVEGWRMESRILVGATLAATVTYFIAMVALGTPPGAADSGEQVVAWFREHRDGVRWSVWALTYRAATCGRFCSVASIASRPPS